MELPFRLGFKAGEELRCSDFELTEVRALGNVRAEIVRGMTVRLWSLDLRWGLNPQALGQSFEGYTLRSEGVRPGDTATAGFGDNTMEKKMKTVVTALIALVIGAGGMYFYQQGSMKQLQSAGAALEAQLSEAKTAVETVKGEVTKLQDAGKALEAELADAKTAAETAKGEIAKLQDECRALEAELADAKSKAESSAAEMAKAMDQKVQEAMALQAKITELEAALTAAKSATGTAQ